MSNSPFSVTFELSRTIGTTILSVASHPKPGISLECENATELLFTENESNASRLWGQPNLSPYVKGAFHRYVIAGEEQAVDPAKSEPRQRSITDCKALAGESRVVRLRLGAKLVTDAFSDLGQVFADRIADANEFYQRITPQSLSEDERRVYRQALLPARFTPEMLERIGSAAQASARQHSLPWPRPRE